MKVQLLLDNTALIVVELVHGDPFDVFHDEVYRSIIFKATVQLGYRDVGRLSNVLHRCRLIQSSLARLPGNMKSAVQGVRLPLGWAEAALDKRLSDVVIFSI